MWVAPQWAGLVEGCVVGGGRLVIHGRFVLARGVRIAHLHWEGD